MASSSDSESTSGSSGSGRFVAPSTAELDEILDAYEFIEIIGQGGMGAVYRARQKSLDREVAIKILPADLGDDGNNFQFAERFQREARAMAKLSHPNIISVFDFGQASDGQLYIVMEYIEGTDLHVLIRGGELTTEHVLGWTSQICDALQYAHGRGIIHRDIKPANVMISREGQVKIADFGLAKLTGAGELEGGLTMTNMAMGTPDYIAPEALEEGITVDHRADLYAVGVMLYEMLTGKVPRGSWKAPSTKVPGLDTRYDSLVERAMDSDLDGRYQNAKDINSTLYEISTTEENAATASSKSLITGAAVEAVASSRGRVSGTVKRDLSSLSAAEESSHESEVNAEGDHPSKKKSVLLIGVAATVIGLTIVGFALRGDDKEQQGEAAATDTGGSAAANESTTSVAVAETEPDTAEPLADGSQNASPEMATDSPVADETSVAMAASASTTTKSPEPIPTTSVPDVKPTVAPSTAAPAPPAVSPSNTIQPKTVATAGPPRHEIDLLPTLSQRRDLIPATNPGAKAWTVGKDGTISTAAVEGTAHIAAPVSLTAADDCEIEFWWSGGGSGGEECLALDLPVGDDQKVVRIRFGFAGDKVEINLTRLTLLGPSVPGSAGRQVKVRRVGNHTLVVQLDDQKPIIHSIDPSSDLTEDLPTHPIFPNQQLPVLTAIGGRYQIIEWKVRVFEGDLVTLEDPLLEGDRRLTQLEKGFQSAVQREVETIYANGVGNLDKGYGSALDRARIKAQQAGNLDDVVAIQREQQRLQSGADLPAADPPGAPAELVKLLAMYREAHAELDRERNSKMIPLYDKYLTALNSYEAELTKSDSIEKALALRDHRKTIAARRSKHLAVANAVPEPDSNSPMTPAAKPSAPQNTKTPLPPPVSGGPATAASRKQLAEWLFSIGAKVVTEKDGQHQDLSANNAVQLPKGNFNFVRIEIRPPTIDTVPEDFLRLDAAPELQELTLESCNFVELPSLRGMTQLRRLVIARCLDISDQLYSDIAALPAVKDVEFIYGNVPAPTFSELALSSLAGSDSIESLRFENVIFTDATLSPLSRLKNLQRLKVGDGKSYNGLFLTSFADHPTLDHLYLFERNPEMLENRHLSNLSTIKSLRRLELEGLHVNQVGLAAIGKLEQLEHLYLTLKPDVDDKALESLAELSGLRFLTLKSCRASGTAFASFQCGPNLRELHFVEVSNINDQGVQAIAAGLPKLERLALRGELYDSAGIEALGSLKELQFLSLNGSSGIDSHAFASLSKLNSLTELNLGAGNFDAEQLGHISAIRNLTVLDFHQGELSTEGFAELSKLRNLDTLNLRSITGIVPPDSWLPSIQKMRSLKRLHLRVGDVPEGSDQMKKIKAALPEVDVGN